MADARKMETNLHFHSSNMYPGSLFTSGWDDLVPSLRVLLVLLPLDDLAAGDFCDTGEREDSAR